MLQIEFFSFSCESTLMCMLLTKGKSALVQVMPWCCQVTSHYLSQHWPRSMSYYISSLGHNELITVSCHFDRSHYQPFWKMVPDQSNSWNHWWWKTLWLLPSSNKPLSEPVLSQSHGTVYNDLTCGIELHSDFNQTKILSCLCGMCSRTICRAGLTSSGLSRILSKF